MKKLFLTFTFLLSGQAQAGLLDLSAFYFSDSFVNTASTATYSRMNFDLCLAVQMSKSTFIGWNYVSLSATDNPGTAETLAVTQMGLKFFYFFGRGDLWRLGLAYNLVTTGTYSPTSAIWKGTGLAADFGTSMPLTETVNFSLRLNYVSSTFKDQFIDQAYTSISTTRTQIYPSIGLSWDF